MNLVHFPQVKKQLSKHLIAGARFKGRKQELSTFPLVNYRAMSMEMCDVLMGQNDAML